VWDALALGVAGDTAGGSTVAADIFARFEAATGEYGAHEMLETTSESNYAEFEEAIEELRAAGLEAGDLGRAREEAVIADTQLGEAQRTLVGETTATLLDLQSLGVGALDAAFLAAAGNVEAAGEVAASVADRFGESPAHDALESTDSQTDEAFESALESVRSAAESGDAEAVRRNAGEAYASAIDGSYALGEDDAVTGAGHMATLQASGWDGAALASMGGPGTGLAHAAALTGYRARAYDSQWLAARGETDRAATVASDIFAHFEGARAHEALEEADGEAYEGFEAGLSELQSAIEAGDSAAIAEAVNAIDANLRAGTEALAGTNAALVEAAFFRARLADADERYRQGESDVAATIAQGLFERFEADELGLHEAVETTSEELYARFEEEHLTGLVEAFENADDEAARTHHEGVQSTLLEFQTQAAERPAASVAEASYVGARGFDAAVLDTLGDDDRALAIAQGTFEHFEAGAGGYHEGVETADESVYEGFEEQLGAVSTAAGNGEDVYPVAKEFYAEVVASMYAIVGTAGGSNADAAMSVLEGTFSHFESARVHELIEEADHNAYETFETALDAYITAIEEDGDVAGRAETFALSAQYAQFALVDAVENVPLDLDIAGVGGGQAERDGGGGTSVSGGPNVVDGVPEDADHVVDMTAAAYEPTKLTVSQGETVAWRHAGGEAHTVTAYGDGIPEGASYWASGGFDSQSAAESGWEDREGGILTDSAFVHTFETTGTHEYYCIPHEAAGMTGTVIVE